MNHPVYSSARAYRHTAQLELNHLVVCSAVFASRHAPVSYLYTHKYM